ncbi:MAG: hypothetical protein AAB131_01500 [Actinomycetota bacterium]
MERSANTTLDHSHRGRSVFGIAMVAALLLGACSEGSKKAATATSGSDETGGSLDLPEPTTEMDFDSATSLAAAEAEIATVNELRVDAGIADLLDPVGDAVLADVDLARTEFAESQLPLMVTELGVVLDAGDAEPSGLLRPLQSSTPPGQGWTGSLVGQASTTTTMSMAIMTVLVERADETNEGRVDRNETYRKEPAAGYEETINIHHQMSVRTGQGHATGTVQIGSTDTLSKDGTPVATLVGSGRGEFELNACPDEGGIGAGTYQLTWTEELTRNGSTGAGTAYSVSAPFRIVVGDDARIQRIESTQSYARGAHGPGTPGGSPSGPFDWGVTATIPVTYSRDGTRSANYDAESHQSNNATDSQIVGVMIGNAMVDHFLLEMARNAESLWRSGKCIELTTDEESRDVDPGEVVEFDVTSKGKFDGAEIAAPIVATLDGPKTVDPAGRAQDPPAHVKYTAGSEPEELGKVKVEQTSRRGIGRKTLEFKVKKRDLQIAISVDYTATGGLAQVVGHIDLPPTALQRAAESGTYIATEAIAHITATLSLPEFCTMTVDEDVVLTITLDPTTTEDTVTMNVQPDVGASENVSVCGVVSLPSISVFGLDVWAFSLVSKAVIIGEATTVPSSTPALLATSIITITERENP